MNAAANDSTHLRVPPHSTEAEQSILGALLLDSAALGLISGLVTAADFYSHAHKTIFGAISSLVSAGQAVDVVTVFEQLDGEVSDWGGLQYLNSLAQSVPSAANIRRYAEIVAERATLRSIIAASDDIASKAFSGAGSANALLEEATSSLTQIGEQRKTVNRRIPILRMHELRDAAQSIRWLVKRVIPADSIGMLFGGSGTFKSFIALDAALHVAHGLPWLGRRTSKGDVLYIAAEGGSGLWSRICAWHRARRMQWAGVPLYVIPAAVDLKADSWRVVDAAQLIGVRPALVVVDTLSQTYSGEENSANEMAAYLRELGLRFRQLWGCSVLLIHHSGHLATERPRGSSAIRGNMDFLIGCFRDEKEMLATVSCVKQKDGDAFDDQAFQLSVHELGTDSDGDAITSLVARHLTGSDEIEQAIESEAKAGRGGKNQLLLRLVGFGGMQEKELRSAFYADCGISTADGRRQAYYRAMDWAKKTGFLEVSEGYVIALKKRAEA